MCIVQSCIVAQIELIPKDVLSKFKHLAKNQYLFS